MKKKILFAIAICVYSILVLLCAKQALNYFYTESFRERYKKEDYSTNEDLLKVGNVIEPYKVYYNNGDICYRNGDYEGAIENFETALDSLPTKSDECKIRINLALSMMQTMQDEYNSPENIEDSLDILYTARDVLTENGCATDEGDGHSKTAEELKTDIDELINQLEEEQQTHQML